MAGHSKWANIKHKKGRADAKKGKVFSRCAKEIISAVKQGGPDPKGNPRLRLAIDKAKAANVPNEVVDRNIKKASNEDQSDYQEIVYELYGHEGVGIIAEGMTDNKNRAASEMRIATNKRGGSIANQGAVAFNFERKGVIHIPAKDVIEDELFLAVSEAGAEDFEQADDLYVITTSPEDLFKVKEAIEALGFATTQAELEQLPKVMVECAEEAVGKNLALVEWIEGIEDIDAVYHNMQIPEGYEPPAS